MINNPVIPGSLVHQCFRVTHGMVLTQPSQRVIASEGVGVVDRTLSGFLPDDVRKKKEILAKIEENFLLSNGELRIESKYVYVAIKNKLPEIRKIEENGRMEEELYGKPKKATLREMISVWSG